MGACRGVDQLVEGVLVGFTCVVGGESGVRDAIEAEVAHLVVRPQSFVSKIEVGERRFDFIAMEVLASFYGKPLSYFEDKAEAQ